MLLRGVFELILCAAVRPSNFRFAETANHFRGQKKEAPPLPMDQRPFVISRLPIGSLKPVRRRLRRDLPASDYSPFIVELFALEDLLRYPVRVTSPAIGLTANRLPTLAHVERPLPRGSEPHGGICKMLKSLAHPLRLWRLVGGMADESQTTGQVCPHRPYSGRWEYGWDSWYGEFGRTAQCPKSKTSPFGKLSLDRNPEITHVRNIGTRITSGSLHRARTSLSPGIRLYRQTHDGRLTPSP